MPANNGSARKDLRRNKARGRLSTSERYPCEHMHVSQEIAADCPASVWVTKK